MLEVEYCVPLVILRCRGEGVLDRALSRLGGALTGALMDACMERSREVFVGVVVVV